MNLMILMQAVATMLAAPEHPHHPIIDDRDYPIAALNKGQEGAVVFTLLLDPLGKPVRCDVDRIIGADFSELVCGKLMRARFTPARDHEGHQVYGVYNEIMNFWLPTELPKTGYPLKLTPQISLDVKREAGVLTESREITLALAIDPHGKVADCGPKHLNDNQGLVGEACAYAKANWTDKLRSDRDGNPVLYVRELKVAFIPMGTRSN